MALIQIATPFNIDIEFEIAEFHKRLAAYLTDAFILFIYLLSMCYLLFGGLDMLNESSMGFVILVIVLPMVFFNCACELLMNGQTIGKKIFKIRVVSLDGGEATFGQYALRWFLRFYEWGSIMYTIFFGNPVIGFLILLLGGIISIIIIATNSRSQRLGDIAAGTAVVNTRSTLTVNDTIFMNITNESYKVTFPEVLRLSDRDINTLKNVLTQAQKNNNYDMCNKVAHKVQDVLKISTNMYANDFIEKLLEDYNYLATKE